MKTAVIRSFAVLLLASALYVPTADALPKWSLYIEYYDCNVDFVGWYSYNCSSTAYSGQQYGSYKYEELWPCDGLGEPSFNWYRWTGSGWQQIQYPPAPPPPGTAYC